MSECRKCGLPIKFERREFGGVLKWYPTNPDGSEHWDDCKKAQRGECLTGRSVEDVRAYADSRCPTFWTFPNGKGGRRKSFTKPEWWDSKPQPAPAEELF